MKFHVVSALALIAGSTIVATAHAEMFNGPTVGFQAGWTQNKIGSTRTDLGRPSVTASQVSATLRALFGYDRRFGRLVLGGEAGFSFGTSDKVSGGTSAGAATVDPKRSVDLTARAGYLETPQTLVYARAGYGNEHIRTTLDSGSSTVSASEDRDAWLVGGGVERAITDKVSARVEYRYSDLSNGHGDYDRNQVLSGIVFHF